MMNSNAYSAGSGANEAGAVAAANGHAGGGYGNGAQGWNHQGGGLGGGWNNGNTGYNGSQMMRNGGFNHPNGHASASAAGGGGYMNMHPQQHHNQLQGQGQHQAPTNPSSASAAPENENAPVTGEDGDVNDKKEGNSADADDSTTAADAGTNVDPESKNDKTDVNGDITPPNGAQFADQIQDIEQTFAALHKAPVPPSAAGTVSPSAPPSVTAGDGEAGEETAPTTVEPNTEDQPEPTSTGDVPAEDQDSNETLPDGTLMSGAPGMGPEDASQMYNNNAGYAIDPNTGYPYDFNPGYGMTEEMFLAQQQQAQYAMYAGYPMNGMMNHHFQQQMGPYGRGGYNSRGGPGGFRGGMQNRNTPPFQQGPPMGRGGGGGAFGGVVQQVAGAGITVPPGGFGKGVEGAPAAPKAMREGGAGRGRGGIMGRGGFPGGSRGRGGFEGRGGWDRRYSHN